MIDYGFIHRYPATNFHELNLDWILAQMIELRSDMKNFVSQNTIKYADPIQWNITTQYESNTVVIEPNSGNAYISSQPVPAGVAITNTDYWSVIGNFSVLYESIKESIAAADDGSNINATEARAEGSLLWLNSKLYKVLSDISVGALYITSGTGQNLQEVTIEELLNTETEERKAEDTSINNQISAINSSILSIGGSIAEINNTLSDYWIDPDNFEGTDPQKIQAAYDAALQIATSDPSYNITIAIKRQYDLTGATILLKNVVKAHYEGAGGYITFLGIGKGGFIKHDYEQPSLGNNFMFKKDPTISGFTYRHRFVNLRFTADEPTHDSVVGYPDPTAATGKITWHCSPFNITDMAWTYVENCYFSNICYAYDNVMSTSPDNLPVGLYCHGNHYIYCAGVFRGGAHQNALFFDHEEVGLCVVGISLGSGITNVCVVRDSIFEYFYFYFFQCEAGGSASKILIDGNYIEGCKFSVLTCSSTVIRDFTFSNNMVDVAGAGTTASSAGLSINCTANNRNNINFNSFNAGSDKTSSFISNSTTPAGTANKCIGNHFTGGAAGFTNIASALTSYLTVE